MTERTPTPQNAPTPQSERRPDRLPEQMRANQNPWAPAVPALVTGVGAGVITWIATSSLALTIILSLTFAVFAFAGKKAFQQARALEEGSALDPKAKELKRRIARLAFVENLGQEPERLAQQTEQLREATARARARIREKFSPSELTFSRYAAAVSTVEAALEENLAKACSHLEDASGVTPDAPRDRQIFKADQLTKAANRMAANETALSQLETLSASLADIKTSSSKVELETALKELEELSRRARNYSV